MHDHGAVRTWSERIDDERDLNEGGVGESTAPGWRRPIADRKHQALGTAPTSHVAHYIQCRCGQVFVSRHSATTRSLLRAHVAQWHAEANAVSGFDAARARRDGENHEGLGGGGM